MLENMASSVDDLDPARCFDAAAALERLDGDEELFAALIEVFHQDSAELLERLSANLAEGNLREVERAAHSLKGLTANFDARRATEAAFQIEQMARGGAASGYEPRVQELGRQIAELRTALVCWEA